MADADLISVPDPKEEEALRPSTFDQFVGQDGLKRRLLIMATTAKEREEPFPHVLFAGPAGLGKTTLAGIIAHEMEVDFRVATAPVLRQPYHLARFIMAVKERGVAFLDEIHGLPNKVSESLYMVMEDLIVEGINPHVKVAFRREVAPFTLAGATTEPGSLSQPLRDRFGYIARLVHYEVEDLVRIADRTAGLLGMQIQERGLWEVGRRGRGVPRVVNRILLRVRDYLQYMGLEGSVEDVRLALNEFGIDEGGFDLLDLAILEALAKTFDGQPVGLGTLATALSEDPRTISEGHEPFLIRTGMLVRTPRGRRATPDALAYLASKGK